MSEKQAYQLYLDGRTALKKGQVDVAEKKLSRSIKIAPHFKTLELLGEALMNQEKWQAAVVPLAAATTLHEGVRAPALLCEALYELGQLANAEKISLLAVKRDKDNRKAKAILKKCKLAKLQT